MYCFGSFTVDERSRQVRRGTQRLQMRSKCFDALVMLARSGGETVGKDQLLETLWPHRQADEASLTQVIYELRRVLGSSAGEVVATIPGIGYRLALEVRTQPADPPIEHYVASIGAYEPFAKGKFLLEKHGRGDFLRALRHFSAAVETNAGYAPAHVGIAQAWNALARAEFASPSVAYPRARAAAQRALELDANLAEAYAALAEPALFWDRDADAAADAAYAGLALNPSLQRAHLVLAWTNVSANDFEQAAKCVLRAIEIAPASLELHAWLAAIEHLRGERSRAVALLRSIVETDPSYTPARRLLGTCFLLQGRQTEGVSLLQRCAADEPTAPARADLGYAMAVSGDETGAQQLLDSLSGPFGVQYVSNVCPALVCVGLRRFDRAMHFLQRAVEERAARVMELSAEPRLQTLRGRADFQALLVQLRLPFAA